MRTHNRTGRVLVLAGLLLLLNASPRLVTAAPDDAAFALPGDAVNEGNAALSIGGRLGVLAPALAEFSAAPLSGPAPLTVEFEDLSTGTPTSWTWDFGDGGSSTVQNPQHVYTLPGVYSVSLTVVNASGGVERRTRIGYITVEAPPGPTVQAYLPALVR